MLGNPQMGPQPFGPFFSLVFMMPCVVRLSRLCTGSRCLMTVQIHDSALILFMRSFEQSLECAFSRNLDASGSQFRIVLHGESMLNRFPRPGRPSTLD